MRPFIGDFEKDKTRPNPLQSVILPATRVAVTLVFSISLSGIGNAQSDSLGSPAPAVSEDTAKPAERTQSQVQAKVDLQAVADRLPELAAAAEANPNNANVIAGYAQALYQLGNLPEAWKQLNRAYQLNPKHGGVANGIQSVMMEFKLSGIFNVNVPAVSVRSVLGEPNQVRDMAAGYRWIYAFMAVDFRKDRIHEIIDLRGATEALFQPQEVVDVALDGRGWQCGFREKSLGSVRANFFLPGQSVAGWTETVEIERVLDGSKIGSTEEIVRLAVKKLESRASDVQHKTLELTDESAIVAFEYSNSSDNSKRHQLTRYFRGPKDLYRLAYTLKSTQPPDSTHQGIWLKILQDAKLKPLVGARGP